MMRPDRRFQPACEAVEGRALPAPLTLLALIGTGVDPIPSFAGSGVNVPVVPLGSYVEPGLDFSQPTTVGHDATDRLGYGGHDSMMAALYAETLNVKFGIQAHVVPLVAGDAHGLTSDGIGRCELWVSQQQAMMRAQGRDVRWVVALAVQPHPFGPLGTEVWGRRALDAEQIPIVQAAGNGGWFGSPLFFDQSPTSIVAQDVNAAASEGEGSSEFGSFVTFASVPPYYASSGATLVTAAYTTAAIEWQPNWPSSWVAYQVRHIGVLAGP